MPSLDFTKEPHLLIAGATGQGKTNALKVILTELQKKDPLGRFIIIDLKRLDFQAWKNAHVINEPSKAIQELKDLEQEMRLRFKKPKGQKIYLVIDELSDLMLTRRKEVEPLLSSLSMLSRAAGYHLIVATQNPVRQVITTTIAANFSMRLCFKVFDGVASRVALGVSGAERLQQKGDALLITQGEIQRVHIPLYKGG